MVKKVGSMILLFVMLFASSAYAYDVELRSFEDETVDYSRDPIYTLSAMGIINGFPDRTYHPDGDLSREAFIKLIILAAKIDPKSASGSKPVDIAMNRWSVSYISIAYQRHWIDSLLDKAGKFHPEQTITRQEVAAVMGKFLMESATAEAVQQWLAADWKLERDTRKFKDRLSINEALQPYVYYTVQQGIMQGDLNSFNPKKPLKRKEAAAVIYRLIDSGIANQRLNFTGFYAIKSYAAINQMSNLSKVTLGWSHLEYTTPGTARLSTDTNTNNIPSGSEEVIAAADAVQIQKDLMVFYSDSNLKDFLKDKSAQQEFIDSLLVTLNDPLYHFTGVNIDFEGLLDETGAPDYLGFLKDLKARIGTLTLSVAVPPGYNYKGYDLRGIGDVADAVILMAHDFTYDKDRLPSAPLPLVNDAIKQALELVPNDKLVLGISKQANQWTTVNGVTPPHTSPLSIDVEKRLTMPGVTQAWMMPYFLKHVTFQDERGSHEMYYEDTASIGKKLWLAKFYGLKGVSLWYMGNFTTADWELIGHQKAQ
jgi:spore germination protein YaaH